MFCVVEAGLKLSFLSTEKGRVWTDWLQDKFTQIGQNHYDQFRPLHTDEPLAHPHELGGHH